MSLPPTERSLWVCHVFWSSSSFGWIIGDWSGNDLHAVCVNMNASEEGLVESDSLKESYKTKPSSKSSPQWISFPNFCWRAAGANAFRTLNTFFDWLGGNGMFTTAFLKLKQKPLVEKHYLDIGSKHKQDCRATGYKLKTHMSLLTMPTDWSAPKLTALSLENYVHQVSAFVFGVDLYNLPPTLQKDYNTNRWTHPHPSLHENLPQSCSSQISILLQARINGIGVNDIKPGGWYQNIPYLNLKARTNWICEF